jgi:DUF4097 and DUF4098 domain-containing protein YvlB
MASMKPLLLPVLLAMSLVGPAQAAEDISKVNGSIHVAAGARQDDLGTVNGAIRVEDGAQVRDVETVNGGITLGERVSARDLSTVNGSIRGGRGVEVGRDVETVNGSVFLDRGSRVGGDVQTVNGSIGLVATQVQGSLETVNGDITVGIGSQVHGGIHVSKPGFNFSLAPVRRPRVVIGPDAVVDGPMEFEREVTLYVHRSARVGKVSGASPQIYDTDTAPRD